MTNSRKPLSKTQEGYFSILAGEYQRWGGMASYSVAPVRAVSAIPEPLDMAQAATLNGGAHTQNSKGSNMYHGLISKFVSTVCDIRFTSSMLTNSLSPGAYETAYHALVHCGRVKQGQFC